jgi:excisionase family DNA binding protein
VEQKLYTVDELSTLLKLHPKTILRFIHEGRIGGRKIGRAWMVSASELRAFTHGELATPGPSMPSPAPSPMVERMAVSMVVEIAEQNVKDASRISNSILAMLNCKDDSWGPARFDFFHFPETGKAKYVLYGSTAFMKAMLNVFEVIAQQEED